MKAEFEVQSSQEFADGSRRLTLQPIGEPGFVVVERLEHEDGESIGPIVIEIEKPARSTPVPRPGDTIQLVIRKPRVSE